MQVKFVDAPSTSIIKDIHHQVVAAWVICRDIEFIELDDEEWDRLREEVIENAEGDEEKLKLIEFGFPTAAQRRANPTGMFSLYGVPLLMAPRVMAIPISAAFDAVE